MEGGERSTELNLALRTNGFSSDLLQKLMKRTHSPYVHEEEIEEEEEEIEEEREDEIELSLGLSMNGRFGVDPIRKKLKRSSSIANLVFTGENDTAQHAPAVECDRYALLSRTRSLPTEVEEEWRRRKEYQSMRRMEAKKKRMEKLKNSRGVKDKENCFDGLPEVINNGSVKDNNNNNSNGIGIHIKSENGNEISSPQGSVGSQRSGSSGLSDAEFLPKEGVKQNGEDQERASNREVKLAIQTLKDPMLDMPYVSTKGEGQKIEGFLYGYKKGEDVRIVCVCHGLFLTPAEFVKHGGGGDVEHPLKHIVVNPFPLL